MLTEPTPEILPPSTQPPVYGPVRAPSEIKPVVKRPVFLIIGVVIILIIGSLIFATQTKKPVTLTPATTPSVATPTPTPIRKLEAFATQSAFIQFESSVASLSASIQNSEIQGPSITAPVLDLQLGFSN